MTQKNTPILTTTAITALVSAILVLLSAFGVPITEDQQSAINGLVAIVAPLVIGLVAYLRTTDNKAVVEVANDTGIVQAGPANEIPTGTVIRSLG